MLNATILSCAMPTADESNYLAVSMLHIHMHAVHYIALSDTLHLAGDINLQSSH